MDHLKEQLKKHYDNTELPAGLRQKLLTLETPEPAPVPVRTSRKRLLTPIAAMLIAAVAILGGREYLMATMPQNNPAPGTLPSQVEITDDAQVNPTDNAADYVPEPTATADPESAAPGSPTPKPTVPETELSAVVKPHQPPANAEPAPDALPEPQPPLTDSDPAPEPGSLPDSEPPPEDVPPNDPGEGNEGNEDEPPLAPGEDDPVDPPVDDPVDPPDNPVDPPGSLPDDPPDNPVDPPDDPPDNPPDDPPINPGPPTMDLPEISGRYAKENGQHIVYLTNCDTGEICTLNLTSSVTVAGYANLHTVFGCWVIIRLNDANDAIPDYPLQSTTPGTSPKPNISEIEFELEIEVICAVT